MKNITKINADDLINAIAVSNAEPWAVDTEELAGELAQMINAEGATEYDPTDVDPDAWDDALASLGLCRANHVKHLIRANSGDVIVCLSTDYDFGAKWTNLDYDDCRRVMLVLRDQGIRSGREAVAYVEASDPGSIEFPGVGFVEFDAPGQLCEAYDKMINEIRITNE